MYPESVRSRNRVGGCTSASDARHVIRQIPATRAAREAIRSVLFLLVGAAENGFCWPGAPARRRKLVVVNDAREDAEVVRTIRHEIAHVILGHVSESRVVSSGGRRSGWLSG